MVVERKTTTMRLKEVDNVEKLRPKIFIHNNLWRCAASEFICTAILLFGGCSSTAQYVLSKQRNNAYVGVCFGWGLSLVFAVYGGFHISGSHLNPAVSLFLLTMGRISVLRFVVYSGAQIFGAFVGAMITYFLYFDALNFYDGGTRQVTGPYATASIFATYPQNYLSLGGGLIDQIVGTAFLCICVCLVTDKNNKIPVHLQPLLIGLIVVLAGMCVGMNSGYAINPARDLGPRLFTLCAGWGWAVFSYRNYTWFWIPIIGPLTGGVLGAWIYELFLGMQMVEVIDEFHAVPKRSNLGVSRVQSEPQINSNLADLKGGTPMTLPGV